MNKFFSLNVFFTLILFTFFSSKEISVSKNLNEEIINNSSSEINPSDSNIFDKKNEWTEQKLSSMTLREKIAQMIISNSDGYTLDESLPEFQRIKNLIISEKISRLIFFKGNSVQEAELINKFQSISELPSDICRL